MFRTAWILALLLAGTAAAYAGEARDPETAAFWRQSTAVDVDAAYRLLLDNHPGALPAAHDAGFRDALKSAYATARGRTPEVAGYPGYASTLAEFANAFHDRHIRSRPTLLPARPLWTGLIVGRRGAHWRVVDTEPGLQDTLLGAQLVSCDDRPVEEIAQSSLGGFRADWNIEAQRIRAAPWFLVDEGNPFAKRPETCVFEQDGVRTEHVLDWRPIRRDELMPRLGMAIGGGAAGFGVRRSGKGYWIALQRLNDNAMAVVNDVRAQSEAMRRAPFVVLDLRGNGGGSSLFGREIANALMGREHVAAILGEVDDPCASVWRTSDLNIATLEEYSRTLGATRGPEVKQLLDRLLAQARDARDAGQAYSGPTICPRSASRAADVPPSLMRGRMAILTDLSCFSSCLAVVDDFRKLGALQLGQATDAATRYTEVRDVAMPSGLSTFSTLQAMAPSEPPSIGPFVPDRVYPGDIADTAALEAWVLAQLNGTATLPGPQARLGARPRPRPDAVPPKRL